MPARLDGLTPDLVSTASAVGSALDAGRLDAALAGIATLLERCPDHPEVQRLHAGILGMQGRHAEAVAAMRLALAQRPQDPAYLNTLATLLGQAGDYDGAIEALQTACSLQPEMALAWYNLGVMLTRSVRNDEAEAALRKAVQHDRDASDARALLADLLRMRGESAQAAAEYRRVLVDRPWSGMAWWGLADLKTTRMAASDVDAMQTAQREPRASDDDRIAIGFALARALDDLGRPAESLQALATANAIARRRQPWHGAAYSAAITALAAAFDPPPAGADDRTLGQELIFIVGMPRSGSTLVEQILASHPLVEGTGELPDLPQVLAEESRRRGQPFPRWVPQMQPADWARLGRRYLERTARWRRHRPRSTDKLPSNWIYADAIRAMLPGAHVVGCRRDALETCFSCYRQRLDNNEYTRDFDDLARFWHDCDRSLERLVQRYPQAVTVHEYEALLASPQARIRALLAFCDLPFDEACLRFHETRRAVRSPSADQVRQPLRQDTVHSQRYGALLDPLRRALDLPPWSACGAAECTRHD